MVRFVYGVCLLYLVPLLTVCFAAENSEFEPLKGYDTLDKRDPWRMRSVYYIMTDRFNDPSGTPPTCVRSDVYCGGTWRGIEEQIEYLKLLNFRGISMSFFVENSPGGYHGYWPIDLYRLNPHFGLEQDFSRLLTKLREEDIRVMMDFVLNHMGYAGETPSFNYFYNPFNKEEYFHQRKRCIFTLPDTFDEHVKEYLQTCSLFDLPDLNHTRTDVQEMFLKWIRYLKSKYVFDGIRYDAAHLMKPAFLKRFMIEADVFGLGEVFLEQKESQYSFIEDYIRAGRTTVNDSDMERGKMSQLDFPYAFAIRGCFRNGPPPKRGRHTDCTQISKVRKKYDSLGLDQRYMGRFVDNGDLPRFLEINNQTNDLKKALSLVFLGEGIPMLWQGTEMGFGTETMRFAPFERPMAPGGREPLWAHGFKTNTELFVFIRMLNYYRYWLELWNARMTEVYVDHWVYSFAMDSKVVVILANTISKSLSIDVSGLQADELYCSLAVKLGDSTRCFMTNRTGHGSISIGSSAYVSPIIFVKSCDARDFSYFIPWKHWDIYWNEAIRVTSLAFFSFLISLSIVFKPKVVQTLNKGRAFQYIMHHLSVDNSTSDKTSRCSQGFAAAAGFHFCHTLKLIGDTIANVLIFRKKRVQPLLPRYSSSDLDKVFSKSSSSSSNGEYGLDGEPCLPPIAHVSLKSNCSIKKQRMSLQGISVSRNIQKFEKVLREDTDLVWHFCLELAVPHLGLNDLMYGGLGKVVETFIRYTKSTLVICAPMYAPFYNKDGSLDTKKLNSKAPLTYFTAHVDTSSYQVNVHFLTPEGQDHHTLYLLLDCYQLFGWRHREDIYSFSSEHEKLVYFSVYNQAVAFIIQSFRVKRAQFHDSHPGIALAYISQHQRPTVLCTLHNGDYNIKFRLGSKERDAYIYAMLNLTRDKSTRSQCEHLGAFDSFHIIMNHIQTNQSGYGLVAVSPEYAARCHRKFSQFWSISKKKIRGVLNALPDDRYFNRTNNPVQDIMRLMVLKSEAKASLQQRYKLNQDPEAKLLAFLGRVTHQKGCDIIARAAFKILDSHRKAQLVMAGPLGDPHGLRAQRLLQRVVLKFPKRVFNGIGAYVTGAEKKELVLACDFFLCPSRFEPCGLADVEMGNHGAIMIGHQTGGLGPFKMPGYYFQSDLDDVRSLTLLFEETCERALSEDPHVLQCMREEAIAKQFPPEDMIVKYQDVWSALVRDINSVKSQNATSLQATSEREFFEAVWLEENEMTRKRAPWPSSKAKLSNILLLLSKSLFRIPTLIGFVWMKFAFSAGTVPHKEFLDGEYSQYWVWFLMLAGLAAPFWQAVAASTCPRTYIILSNIGNITNWICILWALWAPRTMIIMLALSSFLGSMAVPLIGFIFWNADSKTSISQNGIKFMMVSDLFWYASLAIVHLYGYHPVQGGREALTNTGYLFLSLSMGLLIYFSYPKSLPPHFKYFRMRVTGQWKILVSQRKTWMVFSGMSFVDAFIITFLYGIIKVNNGPFMESVALLGNEVTSALFLLLASYILGYSRHGILAGTRLYYSMLTSPFIGLVQCMAAIYATSWISCLIILGCNLCSIRYNIGGVLTLHTLPSRETLVFVTTFQVLIGSVAIYLACKCNSWIGDNTNLHILTMTSLECFRLMLSNSLCKKHSQENLARP